MPENSNHGIHLVALQGSVRPGNNTAKALALVADEIQKHPGISLEIVDPTTMHLPLPGQGVSEDAKQMQQTVALADGVILATPEYHGSFSSVMKLLIDNLGFPSALSGKPVALLGVAAGRIGAIKALEHLRSVASHVGAQVLPGPVSVASVRPSSSSCPRCPLTRKWIFSLTSGTGSTPSTSSTPPSKPWWHGTACTAT